jgi:hypothetical protein
MFKVTDSHYVATVGVLKGKEKVAFGLTIPLTKPAAVGYIKGLPGGRINGNYRVIKRTTARKLGLI